MDPTYIVLSHTVYHTIIHQLRWLLSRIYSMSSPHSIIGDPFCISKKWKFSSDWSERDEWSRYIQSREKMCGTGPDMFRFSHFTPPLMVIKKDWNMHSQKPTIANNFNSTRHTSCYSMDRSSTYYYTPYHAYYRPLQWYTVSVTLTCGTNTRQFQQIMKVE
jgi:hypothetical protein